MNGAQGEKKSQAHNFPKVPFEDYIALVYRVLLTTKRRYKFQNEKENNQAKKSAGLMVIILTFIISVVALSAITKNEKMQIEMLK